MFEKNQQEFNQKGYSVIKSVISSELRDFITQYTLFDEIQNFSAEDPTNAQVLNAHSKYADPAMETLLLTLNPIMEQATGLILHPTYSYYRVYRNGDDLKVHKDRASCEISATLCFNYSYDDNHFKWPIFMDGKELFLDPGDMAIYRGCDLDHWRDSLEYSDNIWHVQGFFHYVDVNGPYADFKYDKRSSIGEKIVKSNTNTQKIKSYILSTE